MNYELLEDIAKESDSWDVPSLQLDLCLTKDSDVTTKVDLIQVCRHARQVYSKAASSSATEEEKIYFPSDINTLDDNSRSKIRSILAEGLRPFNAKISTASSKRASLRDNREIRHIYFRCPRGAKRRKARGVQRPSKRSAENHQLCNFTIRVTCDTADITTPGTSRFFIRTSHGCTFVHNGHSRPAIDPTYGIKDIPEPVLDLIRRMLLKHCPIKVGQSLIQEMTGMYVSEESIRTLRSKEFRGLFSGGEYNQSTGQQLLNFLENSPELHYTYLTASREMGSSYLRVRKRTRKNCWFVTPAEAQKADLNALLDGLQTEGGREVLIAVAWLSDKQLRYFELFPQFIGFDVTHNTNAEKRPMFIIVARTANGKNIPVMNTFFPSEAKWVFGWMFEEAMPFLLGNDTVAKIRLATTDQDEQCIRAFQNAIPRFFPLANLRLCKWHKVNRNFSIKVSAKNKAEDRFISYFTYWMYSFTSSIESCVEETYHKNMLRRFINMSENTDNPQRKIRPSLAKQTREFVEEKFFPDLNKLCFRHYMHLPNGEKADNCATESENASLKKDVFGPKPYFKISIATSSTTQHNQRRIEGLQRAVERNLLASQEQYTGSDIGTGVFRMFETIVVDRIRKLVAREVEAIEDYLYMEKPSSDGDEEQIFYVRSRFNRVSRDRHDPLPIYLRTRKVTISRSHIVDGKLVIECTCCFHLRNGVPCRHIYLILGRDPIPEDFHPRHLVKYEKLCLQNPRYLEECLKQIQILEQHNGVLIDSTFPFEVPEHVSDTKLHFQPTFFSEAYNPSTAGDLLDANKYFYQGQATGTEDQDGGFDFPYDSADSDSGPEDHSLYYSRIDEKVKSTYRFLNSEDMRRWYLREQNRLYAEAIKRNTGRSNVQGTSGVATLPSIDRNHKSSRIRTPGEPSSRKRRKRKGHRRRRRERKQT